MPITPSPPGSKRAVVSSIYRRDVILTDPPNRWNAGYLQRLLAASTGFRCRCGHLARPKKAPLPVPEPRVGFARAGRLPAGSPTRSHYREAPETAGVFYGLQSLRQLLPVEVETHQPVAG